MRNKGIKRYRIIETMGNDLSNWILSELDKRQWTQADLARASGLSRTMISKIIAEKSSLGIESLTGIAKAFRLPISEVLQQAGLLPKIPEATAKEEQLLYLFRQLPESQQQDIINYIDFILSK